jgi:hypothetical protein
MLVYGLVAIGACVAAYFALFTQFAFYDDEGTLLVTVQAFAHGDTLYRDIYSPYGPFYYDVFGGLFALTGWAVTNDASRLIVMFVWVGTGLLFGVSAQRFSGRLSVGVAGMIVAFAALGVLAAEPMHPQGLCVVLLGTLTLVSVSGPTRRPGWMGAAAGATLGALVLTKVNLGSYAAIAVAIAAVLSCEPLYRRRWLRWPAIAGLLVLPLVIMSADLREQWVRDLIGLEFLSALAVLIAASPTRPAVGDNDGVLSRWLLGALLGGLVSIVVIVGFLLLTGPNLAEAFDGIVKQGLKLRDVFTIPLISPSVAVDWGIIAVAASSLLAWWRGGEQRQTIWPGLLRVLAGLTIWFTVVGSSPVSLSPSGNHLALPLALVWVAALTPAGFSEPPYRRFVRVLLPLLAIVETLQVYPVAGSQIGIASVTFVAVGALCLTDGLRQLRAWASLQGWEPQRFGAASAIATVAVATILGFHAIVSLAASDIVAYDERPALPFPEAHRLHVAAPQGEEYAELVDLIRAHRCTTFIGFPNLDSLYLFSSIDPPRPSAPGAWPIVLPTDQQQRVVEEVRASPRPCAVRNDGLAEGAWLHGAPPKESDPLVHYIFNDFKTVDTVNEFQFMLPK